VARVVGSGRVLRKRSALAFLPRWLIGAAINMWIGVSGAGYSMAEEAPTFAIAFGVPPAITLLVGWKLAA
jgi:hypothetical protein